MSTEFDPKKRSELINKTKVMSGLNPQEHNELANQQEAKWDKLFDGAKWKNLDQALSKQDNLEIHRISRKDPHENIGYDFVLTGEFDSVNFEFCGSYHAETEEVTISPCQLEGPSISYSDPGINRKTDLYRSLNQAIETDLTYNKIE